MFIRFLLVFTKGKARTKVQFLIESYLYKSTKIFDPDYSLLQTGLNKCLFNYQ